MFFGIAKICRYLFFFSDLFWTFRWISNNVKKHCFLRDLHDFLDYEKIYYRDQLCWFDCLLFWPRTSCREFHGCFFFERSVVGGFGMKDTCLANCFEQEPGGTPGEDPGNRPDKGSWVLPPKSYPVRFWQQNALRFEASATQLPSLKFPFYVEGSLWLPVILCIMLGSFANAPKQCCSSFLCKH